MLAYANENLGTKIVIKAENVIYQGSFDNVAAGRQLAAQMYDRGVNVIFAAAGGVGVGAITKQKHVEKTETKYGLLVLTNDQYHEGIMKKVENQLS